jgi:hypothetical protein
MEAGLRQRLRPVDLRIAQLAAGMHQQFGLAVASHVNKVGRLAVGRVEDGMLLPEGFLALGSLACGIHEQIRRLARQTVDENVGP